MTATAGIAWALATLAGIVAAVLFVRVRQLVIASNEARISADKFEGELHAAREQQGRESGKLRRKSDELVELRKKHDKLRKRKDGEGGVKTAAASSVTEREIEDARQSRDRARVEVTTLQAEVEALRASEAAARAAVKPPPVTISSAEAERLRAEAAGASKLVEEARKKAAEAEAMSARYKKRLQAQELAYVSLRGDFEAKKDRLTTQNEELERLRALKVTWGVADDDAGAGDADVAAATDDEDTAEPADDSGDAVVSVAADDSGDAAVISEAADDSGEESVRKPDGDVPSEA